MRANVSPKRSVFGQRLHHIRLLRGLSQDRLGVLAGLEEASSSARMSRYESGVHEPPLQFVETLARVLDISAAYFYCSDDRLAEIIWRYSAMSGQQQINIYNQIVAQTENSAFGGFEP